ncbi:hypothetical protein GCM10022261_12060 [Brevibacterium daeguense]|uniref:Cell division protein ZipA n=1 Tax=Brevibacterium daeguense TaxID=909936 RepID=A0ABP8EIB2_9MICO|nr:hypothetical protein [Brevibacterium daeguense]
MWTAIAALAAVVTAVMAIRSLNAQKRIAKDSARPVVVPTIEADVRSGKIEFVLKNYGLTPALDLDVSFDDLVSHGEPTLDDLGAMLRSALSHRIPVFAPGQEWRAVIAFRTVDEDEVPIPDTFTVTLGYVGPERDVRFGEDEVPFTLSVKHLKGMVRTVHSDHDVEQRIKQVRNATDNQRGVLDRRLSGIAETLEIALTPERHEAKLKAAEEQRRRTDDLMRRLQPPKDEQEPDVETK